MHSGTYLANSYRHARRLAGELARTKPTYVVDCTEWRQSMDRGAIVLRDRRACLTLRVVFHVDFLDRFTPAYREAARA